MNGSEKWAIPLCKKIINYCEYCCAAKIKKMGKKLFFIIAKKLVCNLQEIMKNYWKKRIQIQKLLMFQKKEIK